MNEIVRPLSTENEIPEARFNLMDNPEEILADLTSEIDRVGTGERIWLRTLDILAGKFTNKLIPHLERAAKRGADVRIIYDPISTYRTHGIPTFAKDIPLYPNRDRMKIDAEATKQMIDKLKKTNGIQMIQSKPDSKVRQIFPYIGADHLKSWVIGNKVYFGDKNLEDMTFYDMSGFVVKTDDTDLVESIAEVIKSVNSPVSIRGNKKKDKKTQLIHDEGIRGQSRIYERANFMIKNAPKGSYIAASFPLFPSGEILNNLIDAKKKGHQIDVITQSSEFFESQPPIYVINRLAEKSMRRNQKNGTDLRFIFSKLGIHAKYLIVCNAVLFGSNNLAESGIKAGTAELDIYSTDPELVKQILEYHQKLILATRLGVPSYEV
jgi:phosphatidylserine/phosphatidylglycerophosphate/cardiolipin synthase-like enzyme